MSLSDTDTPCRSDNSLSVLTALALALVLSACATANTGGVQKSSEVARAFESYFAVPDYEYYLYNQENNPYAVVGLQKDYFIKSPDWRPLDPNSDKFKKVIDLVKDFPRGFTQPYGSYIMAPEGERIGMWYSTLAPPGISVDPETRRVSINAARPWLEDDNGMWQRGGGGVGIGIGTGGGSGISIGF
jgi:hypothetical protein